MRIFWSQVIQPYPDFIREQIWGTKQEISPARESQARVGTYLQYPHVDIRLSYRVPAKRYFGKISLSLLDFNDLL